MEDTPDKGKQKFVIPKPVKPGFGWQTVGQPEPTTVSGLGQKWGKKGAKGINARTRSQQQELEGKSPKENDSKSPWLPPGPLFRTASSERKKVPSIERTKSSEIEEGLDRSVADGDRPKEDENEVPESLDRSEQDGGRQRGSLDRPEDTGGDRQGSVTSEKDEREESNERMSQPEGELPLENISTPDVQTSDVSRNEIEDILGNEQVGTELKEPDKESWARVTNRSGYSSDPDGIAKHTLQNKFGKAIFFPPWTEHSRNKETSTESDNDSSTTDGGSDDEESDSISEAPVVRVSAITTDHDETIEEMSKANAQTRPETSTNRPMSSVQLEYGKFRKRPEGLAGSISAALIERDERKKDKKKAKKAEKAERKEKAKAAERSERARRDKEKERLDGLGDEWEYPSIPFKSTNGSNHTPVMSPPPSAFRYHPPRWNEGSPLEYASNNNPAEPSGFRGMNTPNVRHPNPPSVQSQIPPSDKSKSKRSRDRKKKKKRYYSSSSSNGSYSDSSESDTSTDSSSSYSSSSSSSSSSEGSKRHKRSRHRRRKRHHKKKKDNEKPKMDKPPKYDGRADLEAFDEWAFKVTNYAKGMKLSTKSIIRLISDLVTGKAANFYMMYVAKCQKEWTLARLFPAMFDYCFPNDILQKLRRKWDNMTQGKSRVEDYAREIEKLARRFEEITERTVVLTFWKGLNAEIRKHMVIMGANPELHGIGVMIQLAITGEKARDQSDRITKSEQGRQTSDETRRPKREWTRFKNRTGGNKHYDPGDKGEGSSQHRNDNVRANAVSPQNSNQKPFERRNKPGPSQQKLSRTKLDELRAEGKCFNCREKGHEQRNCPKLSSMKPPKPAIKTGSISFTKMEKLADRKQRADIYAGHISMIESDQIADELREFEEVELRVHQLCEAVWGEDPLWHNEETRPDCRFSIEANDKDVTVWDFAKGEDRTFDRSELESPEFNIAEIFEKPEPNRTPTSVREGGYPDLGDYQRRDWPAINWMHARLTGQLNLVDEGNAPDGVKEGNRIDIQPTMFGYSVQLDESDIIYNVTHEEVLDKHFSPEWIIDQMLTARNVPAENRGDKFEDKRFSSYVMIMLGMTKIPGQQAKIKKRGTKKRVLNPEGVPAVERTASRVKDKTRKLPEPIVIQVNINGQPIRALLDTGSMADFISTTVVDQLRLPRVTYEKPLSVQLAVHGSRSKINCGTTVQFQYQSIDCKRRFDIANLDNYDAILGTPFLYQHQVAIGFNPSRVVIGSSEPLEMKGPEVATITSAAADLLNEGLDDIRNMLRREAEDLCPDTSKTALPPFRDVNHTIPVIDEKKIYHFRPSKCPDAFREQWRKKKNAYLETGRWRTATGHNAIPLLMIPKMSSSSDQPTLRTVFDKREQNANTNKLASPLPDIEEILREVSRHKYRSLIDGKDAYEQIRIVPEHVSRTIFTTPDGTMESLVMQQGDCNAGATYQTLMNHIFASYLGVFVYVYLDDIIIFSDTIEDHVKHVRLVFDILRKEKLYLGPSKMQFFAEELKILGHVIDDQGISMDPHKVDKVLNWKTPTNKELLRSFIGVVGFLAPDCKGIRIPMGYLSGLTSEGKVWRWGDTEQRAFDEVKKIVNDHRDQRREALDYSEGAPPIWVTTDGCLTGGGGYVSQGVEPDKSKVVGFWSGKWSAAQQNYPVHEQELLALVETLKRFRGILHGTRFTVRTDHKALIHLKKQRDLSPRQHRWLDVLNEFDFEIEYIPGETNGFADALSRIYSDDQEGVVRADSEYVNDRDEPIRGRRPKTHPIYVEPAMIEVMNADIRRSSRLADKPEVNYKETRERKAKVDSEEVTTTERELPDQTRTEDDLKESRADDEHDTEKVSETAERLFGTISSRDEPFPQCLKGRYEEDPMFQPILENPSNFTNFEIKEGLVFYRSEGIKRLAIPNVKINDRSIRETVIRQGHSILAHLGGHKTVTYLRDQVWWKTLVQDVTDYCKSCPTCASSKSPTEKPRGLLKTMPVPTHPWQYIGIDFVGPLPESTNRNGSYDMICVIIDLLTAMVHLVATRQTYKATDIAEVIFDSIYKLHGIPERIISDRDSLFTSHFWKKLHALLNVELRMSSAFHPQTDGATERANRTMTQMLRQCVGSKQKDWAIKLPAIEFAMNSARSSTTGFTPFYLNYGRNPSPMIWKGEEVYPGVRQFAENMKDAIMSAHDAIIASRVQHTVQANRKRQPATFVEGDLVYLSTKNISLPKGRARKLAPKYLGPFPITKVIKEGATYQLGLSDELIKRGVNKAFHASLLRPHVPNDDRRFPGRLPIQIPGFGEKPDEWIVDSILTHHGKGKGSEFQILWKAGDKTWASYREVAHLNALDRYCELMGVEDAAELPPNYDDVGSDNEGNIIQVQACRVREDKRDERNPETFSNRSLFHSYFPLLYSIAMDNYADRISEREFQECANYEVYLRARHRGIRLPRVIKPLRWDDFIEVVYGCLPEDMPWGAEHQIPMMEDRRPAQTYQQVSANTVSMPSEALETIIRAIGRTSNQPVPVRPQIITRYERRPPPNINRGRGGYNGRGRGRGGGQPPNRRARRGRRTEDPRIANRPIIVPAVPEPINNQITAGTSNDITDLSFLDEFANTDITAINGEDIAMTNSSTNGEDIAMINETNTEGEFTA